MWALWRDRVAYLWRLLRDPVACDLQREPPTVPLPTPPVRPTVMCVLMDADEREVHSIQTMTGPRIPLRVERAHGPRVPPTIYALTRLDAKGRWIYRQETD